MACILIIDDNEDIRRLLRRMLESDAHEVMEAGDGAEGLKRIAVRKPDLVITDIFMPEKDGLEILREIRKTHPGMNVIAISGGGQLGNMDILRMARSFGAFCVMAKPFSLREMLQTVNAALASPHSEYGELGNEDAPAYPDR